MPRVKTEREDRETGAPAIFRAYQLDLLSNLVSSSEIWRGMRSMHGTRSGFPDVLVLRPRTKSQVTAA